MKDFFAVLGLPRRVDLEAETVRLRFKESSQECHPDAGGDPGDFALLNEARETLFDPGLRLRHWIDLEFGAPSPSEAPLEPSLTEFFQRICDALQRATQFAKQRKNATSRLGRALLSRDEASLQSELMGLSGEVLRLQEEATLALPMLDSLRDSNPPEAMARALELSGRFRFLRKWQVQLQEKLGELAGWA